MKKICQIVCCIAIAIGLLCGCAAERSSVQLYGYQSLRTDAERQLYKELDQRGRIPVPEPFAYDRSIPAKRVWEIIDIYVMDYPEVFWIRPDAPCTFPDGRILLTYTAEGDELESMRTSLEEIIGEFQKTIGPDDTPYEAERKINEFIIERCSYNYDALSDDKYYEANERDAYGALVDGRAICEGYARAAKLLLDRCGINNVLVLGHMRMKHTGHIVNAVELDGEWYYLDVTNNDYDNCPAEHYQYFNCTTAYLKNKMTIDPLYSEETLTERASLHNIYIPECNGTKYNLLLQETEVLDTDEYKEAIIPKIAAAAKEGKTWYAFRIEDEFFDEAFQAWLYVNDNLGSIIRSVNEYNGNKPKLKQKAGGRYFLIYGIIAINLIPAEE